MPQKWWVYASLPLILFRSPPFTQESNLFSSLAGGYQRQEKGSYVGQTACGPHQGPFREEIWGY